MFVRILIFFLSLSSIASAKVYYVATNGNDMYSGTIERPWKTWGKAFTSEFVKPGDTVFFRGGIYPMSILSGSGYSINRNGIPSKPVCFFNFKDEIPILDCDDVIPKGNINFGIRVLDNISYVHFKGLNIRNLWSVRTGVECIGWRFEHSSNVIIENCTIYNIHGIAFENWGAYNTYYVNCDAFNCCDSLALPGITGGRGTGFSSLNTNLSEPRTGSTYYKGCRAWRCSDQGFSFYNSHYVEVENCWSFCNGALETGDGHGFKLGFTPGGTSLPIQRKVVNCLAAFNRATGITTNEGGAYVSQNMEIYNNTIYHTGFYKGYSWGYGIWIDNTTSSDSDELKRIFKNNIVYINQSGPVFLGRSSLYNHSNNSWDINMIVSNEDFISLDSTGISGPRNRDGSLPILNFLKLASNSEMIDRGEVVGMSYSGSKPDLGAFESIKVSSDITPVISITVEGEGGERAITTDKGILQLSAKVLPFDATIKSVTWSIKYGLGLASVNPSNGRVTAMKNGTVTIWAVANDGSGVIGSYVITISNQKDDVNINMPPVIRLNYNPDVYSGFIGEIDGSGCFDENHDSLTFVWEAPGNIPLSSGTASSIKYLAPIVSSALKVEFILKISDGKTTHVKRIPIKIIPYEPQLVESEISVIESSSFIGPYNPNNICDGDIKTMWLVEGDNQWILIGLKQPFNISHIKLAFDPNQAKEYRFDIYASNDKIEWEPILTNSLACRFSGNLQVFELTKSKIRKEFNFVKFVGLGNSTDKWNCISEFKIYGIKSGNSVNKINSVTIFPSPAENSISIRINDNEMKPDLVEFIDLSGVVFFKSELDPDSKHYTLVFNLRKGLYIVELKSGRCTLFTQKVLVTG